MKKLIIDSNFLGHRAKYSFKGLSHEEIQTGVLYGFLREVLVLCQKFETNDLVFCWDSKKSIRRLHYDFYKDRNGNKDEDDIALDKSAREQFVVLRKKILPQIGWKNQVMQCGYESDDLMTIIAKNHKREKEEHAIVVTCDEDLLQILGFADIWNPMKKILQTNQTFANEWDGMSPVSWGFAKAIAGCTSDTVPGIRGIGMATAMKFLKGDLPAKSKKYKAIMDGHEIIDRNQYLVLLPLRGTLLPDLIPNAFNEKAFRLICRDYGMRSFLKKEKYKEWKEIFRL